MTIVATLCTAEHLLREVTRWRRWALAHVSSYIQYTVTLLHSVGGGMA